MKNFLWKIYFFLLVLSIIGAAGLLPYSKALPAGNVPVDMPDSLLLLATFLQAFLLTAIAAFFGHMLSRRTGLGTPVIENIVYKGQGTKLRPGYHVLVPALIGLIFALIMIFADLMMIKLFQIEAAEGAQAPVWWRGLSASLYGGLSEEIMMRLFAMNLIIFLFNSIGKNSEKKSSAGKVVTAMILSSVIFGIGHLAAAFAVGTATPGFVARTLILNFIPGMAFGWLYWRRSLISAMIAYFAADIVLHVVARFIIDNFIQAF